jgi:hypothetical protein
MIRSVFATLAAFVVVTASSAQGCKASGVGDPCIPEQEYDPTFLGFDPQEVNVESKSFQCLTRLCLVNHFRGRVTCPYGQDKTGQNLPGTDGASSGPFPKQDMLNPPNNVSACYLPGSTNAVTGDPTNDPTDLAQVHPQCVDREASNTVYCSCRCANAAGKTDDGANYCTCPDGYDCSQLVTPIGPGDVGLTGAYCIKKGTEYQSFSACQTACDPTSSATSCPPPPIQ